MSERVAIMLLRVFGGVMLVIAGLAGLTWNDPFWKRCVQGPDAAPVPRERRVQEIDAVKPTLARPVTRWHSPPLYDGGPRTTVMHGCLRSPYDGGFNEVCAPQCIPGSWCTLTFDVRVFDGGTIFWYGGPYLGRDNGVSARAGDLLSVDGRDLCVLANQVDGGASVPTLYGSGCE